MRYAALMSEDSRSINDDYVVALPSDWVTESVEFDRHDIDVERERAHDLLNNRYSKHVFELISDDVNAETVTFGQIIAAFIIGTPERWRDVFDNEVGEELMLALDQLHRNSLGKVRIPLARYRSRMMYQDVRALMSIEITTDYVQSGLAACRTLATEDEIVQAYAFLLGVAGVHDDTVLRDLLALPDRILMLRFIAAGIDGAATVVHVRNDVDIELAIAL
jgi:hypothetical protein